MKDERGNVTGTAPTRIQFWGGKEKQATTLSADVEKGVAYTASGVLAFQGP